MVPLEQCRQRGNSRRQLDYLRQQYLRAFTSLPGGVARSQDLRTANRVESNSTARSAFVDKSSHFSSPMLIQTIAIALHCRGDLRHTIAGTQADVRAGATPGTLAICLAWHSDGHVPTGKLRTSHCIVRSFSKKASWPIAANAQLRTLHCVVRNWASRPGDASAALASSPYPTGYHRGALLYSPLMYLSGRATRGRVSHAPRMWRPRGRRS